MDVAEKAEEQDQPEGGNIVAVYDIIWKYDIVLGIYDNYSHETITVKEFTSPTEPSETTYKAYFKCGHYSVLYSCTLYPHPLNFQSLIKIM